MNVIIPKDILDIRGGEFYTHMVNAAIDWLEADKTRNPQFSYYGKMVFNDNDDADEIGDIVVGAGEKAGGVVDPWMTANSIIDAKNILNQGYDIWLETSRKYVA